MRLLGANEVSNAGITVMTQWERESNPKRRSNDEGKALVEQFQASGLRRTQFAAREGSRCLDRCQTSIWRASAGSSSVASPDRRLGQ